MDADRALDDFLATVDPGSATAVAARFLATTFHCPAVLAVAVRYWLDGFVPLPVAVAHRDGDSAAARSPAHSVVAMAERLLHLQFTGAGAGGSDLVCVSQGGIALSIDAKQAHYVHYLSMVPPTDDFAMAVPVREYARYAAGDAWLASFYALLVDVDAHWDSVVHGGLQGQFVSSRFCHAHLVPVFARPALMVGLLLRGFLAHLAELGECATAALGDDDGIAQELVDALAAGLLDRSRAQPDLFRPLSDLLRPLTDAVLQRRSVSPSALVVDIVDPFLRPRLAAMAARYETVRVRLSAPFAVEQGPQQPWRE